jgi:PPOX class probable F420-dependent enzyme
MTHEPRLTTALRTLLHNHRVAALATLDADGFPFVSMVPFAVEPSSAHLVIHVSGLAAHTRNLQAAPRVSLLVMQAEVAGARVTLEGVATVLERDSAVWRAARDAYLARFADAEPMTALGDFMFVGIAVQGARQVAGFGAARSLDAETMAEVLRPSL